MKVLVAGGTGFLGRHIVRELLNGGHDVTVLSRNPSSVPAKIAGVAAVGGDVTESATLSGKLHGFGGLVNAAQFPNHPVEKPRRGLTYDRYDRQGTENLLAEARRARVDRFVYLSGAGADSSSDRTWYRAKGRAEEAIASSGIDHAILRPSWAYGPGDRAINRMAAIARFSPIVPRIGARPQHIQPVYAGDIGRAVARIFEVDKAWGKTFEIGGPQVLTMQEVIETMLRVMGKRRLIVPVPTPMMKLATAPLSVLPKPPLTPHAVDFAVQDGVVDTSLLRALLEIEPVSLEKGLRRYLS